MPIILLAFRVPKNVHIKGDVNSKYACMINGSIEGCLRSQKTVVIKKGAEIQGDVYAKSVKISGTVTGDVRAVKIHVLPGGHVKGKILADIVRVDKNGIIEDVESVQTVSVPEAPPSDQQSWF
jgi:cytoskeletal protein CcmA (bactofilin family)